MLRVSKLTDYGVVLGTHLASVPALLFPVSQLAEATGIPQPTVAKVMKLLHKAGIVESVRGARGGYRLATPGEQVSVLDLITALEGPVALTECQVEGPTAHGVASGQSCCEYEGRCDVQGNWQQINEAIRTALAAVSLAEMAGRSLGQKRHKIDQIVPIMALRKGHD